MVDKIRFVALGGLDSNGNNCYCLEINGDIFVISAGIGYPDKFASGIDFIIPDFSYLVENKDRVVAYLISHGHDDTLGAITYLYEKVKAPIYASKFTKYLLQQLCKQRNVNFDNYDVREQEATSEFYVKNHKIRFFQIAHSLPETSGIAISTSEGNVVFSGDFIIESSGNKYFNFDFKALAKLSEENNFLLLMDSLNSSKTGYTSPSHRVSSYVRHALNDCNGRLYVSVYYQNIYNFIEIMDECIKSNRYICFYDEETYEIYHSISSLGIYNVDPQFIIHVDDISKYKDSSICIIISGMGDLLYRKISMLALKDIGEQRFYISEDDTFLLLTPAASNFEVLAVSCLDELYKTDCNVINISRKQIKKMHPSEDDIKLFISLINPKYYIPLKGVYQDLIANAEVAASMKTGLSHKNIYLLDNGTAIDFVDGEIKLNYIENDKVKVGYLMVDGIGVGDVESGIIMERNKLSEEGIVVMSLLVSLSAKKIIGGPDIQMRGYLYLKESETILKGIENLFIETVNKYLEQDKPFNKNECISEIKELVSKYTRRTTLRCPVIEPEIILVD